MTAEEALSWAERVVDGRGMPIDRGIIRLVAGLHRCGIETEMSCEGHQAWGAGYPSITFSGHENYQTVLAVIEAVPALERFEVHVPNLGINREYGYCELRPNELPGKPDRPQTEGLMHRLLLLRPGPKGMAALEKDHAGGKLSMLERLTLMVHLYKWRLNKALWRFVFDPVERRRREPADQAFRDACQYRMPQWRRAIESAADQLLAD